MKKELSELNIDSAYNWLWCEQERQFTLVIMALSQSLSQVQAWNPSVNLYLLCVQNGHLLPDGRRTDVSYQLYDKTLQN